MTENVNEDSNNSTAHPRTISFRTLKCYLCLIRPTVIFAVVYIILFSGYIVLKNNRKERKLSDDNDNILNGRGHLVSSGH
jgi:hypothetical protein